MIFQYNKQGLAYLKSYISIHKPSKIIVLTDSNTRAFCLPELGDHFKFTNVNLKEGDENKNLTSLQYIYDRFLEEDLDRNSLVINLGGGVITDIGGFAAATFKRGLEFIHIPTTLLGMVDASIGGKNGINYRQAKNQIGTIIPPEFVWVNSLFLNTLPKKEMLSGYAEMLKHGLIADKSYWSELQDFDLNPEHKMIETFIQKSIHIKTQIVQQDPNEKNLRKTLNFGHTLGHAIESYMNYQKKIPISHGHAVAIGMILSAYLSNIYTGLESKELAEIKQNIFKKFPFIQWDDSDIDAMINLLKYDKKNIGGVVQFVLLKSIGTPVINIEVSDLHIKDAFAFYKA